MPWQAPGTAEPNPATGWQQTQTPAPWQTPVPGPTPTPWPAPGTAQPNPPTGWQQSSSPWQPAPTGWQPGYPPAGQDQRQHPWASQYPPAGGQPRRARPGWLVPVLAVAGVLVLGAGIFGLVRLADDDSGPTAAPPGLSQATVTPDGQAPGAGGPTSDASGSGVPDEYVGVWAGLHGDVLVILELTEGDVGDVVGSTIYDGYCVEEVTLLSVDPSAVHVHEQADPGSSCSDEDITLTLDDEGNLTLRYDSIPAEDERAWIHLTRPDTTST
ncbi:hypothetical protein I6A84_02075 [Frankia sp. CNm7]|uniref:Uncharacterized protein n=1 Tax=Frankia nepalensis TaxID=1836974 RepID=A0A937RC71_9ACTN|nr:hypothetical protein [Frankia nepalensis]MBL7497337.1 hypothetical protein [Frankia nepalensis]MBL7509706.1 hypothetical protein [Frankia nepalensis]MBL7516946.1 hypothetical protein [Frankia nepalensis]MBL7629433.1 hypothetical protein [Frankia nepalensis]